MRVGTTPPPHPTMDNWTTGARFALDEATIGDWVNQCTLNLTATTALHDLPLPISMLPSNKI